MIRTLSIYHNMCRRLGDLPFSKNDLRGFSRSAMGAHCPYCYEVITPKNFSIDHEVPVSRGGSRDLSNLTVTCKSCNTAKGVLTGWEFEEIMKVLREFDEKARMYVLRSLKAGAAVVRLKFLGGKS